MNKNKEKLRVAFINKRDKSGGGAFIAGFRLAKSLMKYNIGITLFVQLKTSNELFVKWLYRINSWKMINLILAVVERVIYSCVSNKNSPGSLFSIPLPSFPRLSKKIKNADIIHLHWINQGTLSLADLRMIRDSGKPVVWTFHDSNAFTGGCHVKYDCRNFEKECGNCPYLRGNNHKDLSYFILQQKKKTYANFPFTIIAPSQWMANEVKRSSALSQHAVRVIPNTLDTDTFKPSDKNTLRAALGLPHDKKLLLSGIMPSKRSAHKGFSYLVQTLEALAKTSKEPIELLFFGQEPSTADRLELPFTCRYLGTIHEEQKLAAYYALSDAFLLTSLDDNLPNTVLESLSCGTPVVSFRVGGVPDMIDHLKNGYLATYKSPEDFAKGIRWVLEEADPLALSSYARKKTMDNFAPEIIAKKHFDLYQELIQKIHA